MALLLGRIWAGPLDSKHPLLAHLKVRPDFLSPCLAQFERISLLIQGPPKPISTCQFHSTTEPSSSSSPAARPPASPPRPRRRRRSRIRRPPRPLPAPSRPAPLGITTLLYTGTDSNRQGAKMRGFGFCSSSEIPSAVLTILSDPPPPPRAQGEADEAFWVRRRRRRSDQRAQRRRAAAHPPPPIQSDRRGSRGRALAAAARPLDARPQAPLRRRALVGP